MYSRPNPGETEDDLLRLQREFERQKAENKIKPAATAVSTKSKENEVKEDNSAEVSSTDIQEQLANTFEAIPKDMRLKPIIEKQLMRPHTSFFKFTKGKGFPQAKRRDVTVAPGEGSIFSQHIKRLKREEVAMDVDSSPITENTIAVTERTENLPITSDRSNSTDQSNTKGLPSQSFVLTGSESSEIHTENLNVMKRMTEQEILEERESLIATMDPALIAFLKSRRNKEQQNLGNRNMTIKEQNAPAEDVTLEDIETTAELLSQPKADKWLNFDIVEANKLAWMKDVDVPTIKKSKKFEARFDFEGWLLPYSEPEINENNRTLYHHGEEPGRPGYTLQELFQLSRSSIIQQKILALNTIANILSLHSTGVYDEILDLPFEQIFFVVRFCLDDNTPAILNASIKAMRNLVFSQVDETCLDSLLGFNLGCIQPTLAVDNDMEDDYTVNDQQLAEKNLVKCLARTDIFTRIRYIINTIEPPIETVVYCLDILVRLSRDSNFIVSKLLSFEGLIESIVRHFVPKVLTTSSTSSSYGLPLLQAVRLLRILSSRNKIIAEELLKKYKVMDSIVMYISNDAFSANVNGIRLQTECMHYWSLLVHYGLTLDFLSVLQPVLVSLLEYHLKNTNFEMKTTFVRHGHVAALLILLGNAARQNFNLIVPFLPLLLEQCFPKWTTQFGISTDYACGKLQLMASLIYCMSCIRSYQQIEQLDELMLKLLLSGGFQSVTENIESGSMLLNNYDTHKTSANLKSLEAAAWHTMDHVVPVIQTNSCLPMLCAVTKYLTVTDDEKVKLVFLTHENIQKYLLSLQKLEKYYLTSNWFARPESALLMNILKISVAVQQDVDTSVFYELAVKCLSVFNSEQKPDIEFLFKNLIFCSKFFPCEVLMEHLDVNQRTTDLEVSLSNLGEIFEVYVQVLGLKNDVPDTNLSCSLDTSIGNVIPIDWIYTPILVLYAGQLQNKNSTDEERQIFTVRNCLRWILIYETYFPFLAAGINPTDKFCRLACVFLGSDSLFLTKEIHDLLEVCFKNVITKSEHELNFSKEIQGLSNFQDFYIQLLEQYQSVSYGDVLFGNIILVPLAQKHNIQYRKTLWSEYIGVVQTFSVTPEQAISNLKLFVEPAEDDLSLLTCYRRAIVNNFVRKHSVLYKIVSQHVETFLRKRKTKE